MSILISFLIVIHVIICLLMVLVVLMQRPRSEGLGAAFGGGVADNLFGAQTTHVLQKFTVWLGVGFFAVTLLLAMLFTRATAGKTKIQSELLAEPAPAAPTETAMPSAAETQSTERQADSAATGTPAAVGEAVVVEEGANPSTPTADTKDAQAAQPAAEASPAETPTAETAPQ